MFESSLADFYFWSDILRNYFLTHGFLSASLIFGSKYFTIEITKETTNSCLIVFMMYLLVFLLSSCKLRERTA